MRKNSFPVAFTILVTIGYCLTVGPDSEEDDGDLKYEYDDVDPANQRRALARLDEISLSIDKTSENVTPREKSKTFEEILEEDNGEEDYSTKLIRRAQALSMMMLLRSMKVHQWQEDFDDKVIPAFTISNNYLYKLNDMPEIDQDYRDLIVKLIAQAKENIKIIATVWRKYRKDLEVLKLENGGIDDLTKEYHSISKEYEEKLESGEYEWGNFEKVTVRDCLDIFKSSMPGVIKKEEKLQRMYFVFFAEQENLIKLGTNLWVNSQVDSEIMDDVDNSEIERERQFYQKKLNERRKKAVSVYNDLKKRYEKNETTSRKQKDEL